jgi:hypothetical protein
MTIGPAPMIRIEEMSVRLGIRLQSLRGTQKKGALSRVLRTRAERQGPRAAAV